ncbi:MAG: hypothetical protein JRI26_13160 [Deltaproteobacteria bacterium]|nr:hypothetical protein [Deltaproteobacteria bacterium]
MSKLLGSTAYKAAREQTKQKLSIMREAMREVIFYDTIVMPDSAYGRFSNDPAPPKSKATIKNPHPQVSKNKKKESS